MLQLAHNNATGASGGDATVELEVSTAVFPHPEISGAQRDFGKIYGTQFMIAPLLVNFVIKLKRLVVEKENRLKLVMRMMGTRDSAMWSSWGTVLSLASSPRRPWPSSPRPSSPPRCLCLTRFL